MSNIPQAAALGGIALVILMAGVLAGYMIAMWVTERREYDTEIEGYESKRAARPLLPWELEAPKSAGPPAPWDIETQHRAAPPFGHVHVQAAWPRPSRVMIIAAGSQASRYPLEDTGRILLGTDAEELRELEVIATANREAMCADNAAWLEAWSKAAP